MKDPELQALRATTAELESVAVGLSGGVDSSLVAAVSHDVLGPGRAVAVVARSPSLPARELDAALATAAGIGIEAEVVETNELDDPRYAANPRNRCWFCRDHQFAAIRAVADRRGLRNLADGEVLDDLDEHRPGRAAAAAWGVRSPLRESGLNKGAVRRLARLLGLPAWDKPALACLSSRIPTGSEVTPEKLRQVERAEDALAAHGFGALRVRHHGLVARLELPAEDHSRALALAADIVDDVRAAGFTHVALDLVGLAVSRQPPSELPLAARQELPIVRNASPAATARKDQEA